jgi:hypothetical protein
MLDSCGHNARRFQVPHSVCCPMMRPDFMTPVNEHCRIFHSLILTLTGALEPEETDYRTDLVLFVSFTSDAKLVQMLR